MCIVVMHLCSACSEGASMRVPKMLGPIPIDSVFDLDRPIQLHGTAAVPLFSTTAPYLRGGVIFLSDYHGHRILMYGRGGEFVGALGRRGSGRGEFQMPYGIAFDRAGRMFVTDRANQRIQVLTTGAVGDTVFESIQVSAQLEQLFLVEPRQGDVEFIVQGVTRCDAPTGCVFTHIDVKGDQRAFGRIPPSTRLFTWHADRDSNGDLYVANVLGSGVEVHSPDASRRRFLLTSPSMMPFPVRDVPEPGTAAQLTGLLKRLRSESYTQVRSVVVLEKYVIVQFERRNASVAAGRFFLDGYDKKGCLLWHGVATPGVLRRAGAGLVFFDRSDSGYGTIRLTPARLRRSNLRC